MNTELIELKKQVEQLTAQVKLLGKLIDLCPRCNIRKMGCINAQLLCPNCDCIKINCEIMRCMPKGRSEIITIDLGKSPENNFI